MLVFTVQADCYITMLRSQLSLTFNTVISPAT